MISPSPRLTPRLTAILAAHGYFTIFQETSNTREAAALRGVRQNGLACASDGFAVSGRHCHLVRLD